MIVFCRNQFYQFGYSLTLGSDLYSAQLNALFDSTQFSAVLASLTVFDSTDKYDSLIVDYDVSASATYESFFGIYTSSMITTSQTEMVNMAMAEVAVTSYETGRKHCAAG